MESSYLFANHQLKPTYTSVIKTLQTEYDAQKALNYAKHEIEQNYDIDNFETTYLSIETLRNNIEKNELKYLINHEKANEVIEKLFLAKDTLHKLNTNLRACLVNYENEKVANIKDNLENIAINIDGLQELMPSLKDFVFMPLEVKNALRNFSLQPLQTEATMANTSLQSILTRSKTFANADLQTIEWAVSKIKQAYEKLLKLNADYIRASIRKRFLQNMELSNTAISQLNADQKLFKKNYNEGRKVLENEFGKSMRFKSIRELSAKESGLVLKDLKPVWLMSPLSVSDSLPIDTNYFDVVIFDEASQITLEEGIPALYRSTQTIIVGDDKQMPPTNFFSAKAEDPDDLENFYGDENDELLSADADSLLVQGTRKLDSTMLSWHYRSHYETLISYSNNAFYDASLLTIPDKTIQHNEKAAIEILKSEDAITNADALFDRSISFHFHPNAVYEKRNNIDEANYIAFLVCTLLKRKVNESIGIVAFSQEQQNTIEDALTNLAATDKEFELLLEEAYNRTENDQFIGLIIKNLENIQGDERDIIIMSVCYGFDARKKMFMNFGPINKKGGEKRLNVIFSRAKKHMAIVSSIKHFNITNEYNEGANYFRRFLQYAENISLGNMQIARTILDGLVVNKSTLTSKDNNGIVLKQIKEQLEIKGYQVTAQVGQSDFKCSLAVKLNAKDLDYTLSILLDDEKHYSNQNLIEQYYQRPAILQSFGWRTIHVFAKDWLLHPDRVILQILKRLKEEPVVEQNQALLYEENANTEETNNGNSENSAVLFIENIAIIGFEDLTFERYVFSDNKSNKFWEIASKEDKLIVRYGRVGTRGQSQIKTFTDNEKVENEKQRLVKEKKVKGYIMQ